MNIDSDIHGNKILWRYMDLEKFLDLVINKRLYLTKASILTDQYESKLPIDNQEKLEKYLTENLNNKERVKTRLHNISSEIGRIRESTYISSWSKHTDESYALWKIYLSNNKIGVAVKTTASKLQKSIINCEYDFIDLLNLKSVSYSFYRKFDDLFSTDLYSRDFSVNKHLIITNKNKFYTFEKEVRLYTIVWDATNNFSRIKKPGIYIELDPVKLINEVVLSPFVSDWFKPSFKKMISTINPELSEKITHSRVADF